ncbi:hypothetical protein IWW57_001306 [Coemansia sp. S610]|nr:hypothetical protein IWW57_001306 [Coemansia sp. S610]KAJ2696010.1 hypothetical protein H4218_004882 [Coemansia sp. IMI 209128]
MMTTQIFPTPDPLKLAGLASPPIQSAQLAHELTSPTINAESACLVCGATLLAGCDRLTHEINTLIYSITADCTNAPAQVDNGVSHDEPQVLRASSSSSLPDYLDIALQAPSVFPELAQSAAATPSIAQANAVVAEGIRPRNRRRTQSSASSTSPRRRPPAHFAHSNQLSFPPPVQDALLQILRSIRNHPYPNARLIEFIQLQYGLTKKQIQNWFALRRYRYMTRVYSDGAHQWHFRDEDL